MNIESLMLNVCEVLNEHTKQFKELSELDTSKMSFQRQLDISRKLCVLHGAITAYEFVLGLSEDRIMKG